MENNQLIKKKNLIRGSILMVLLFLTMSFNGYTQNVIEVKGTVTSAAEGFPIPGVAVIVKGTTTGGSTDFDGNYTISAKLGDVLVFTYIGKKNITQIVSNSTHNIAMEDDVSELDAVVVVGYGAVTKKELTGAVSRIESKDLEQFVTSDVASALQGQIAGVSVSSNSGEPGANANIQIRGITSLNGSNTPLYVVNGIPQIGDPRLAPNEIETIDVLKDAASAAIYGSRGAAGVILITTKKGKNGVMKIDLNYNTGFQFLGEGTPLMNTEDQIFFELATFNNTGIRPPINQSPEWIANDNEFESLVLNETAEVKTYSLNVTGGTDKFSYSAVGSVFDQDGALVNSNFKRYNGRITTTYNTGNWKIDASLATTHEKQRSASNNLLQRAIRFKPYIPALDIDNGEATVNNSGGVRTPISNLIAALQERDITSTDRTNTNLSVKRKLTEGLDFITNFGSSVRNDTRNIFRPRFELFNIEENDFEPIRPEQSGIAAISTRTTKLSWDAGFNLNKQFGKHNVRIQTIGTLEEDNRETFRASIEGVEDNNVTVLDGGTLNENVSSGFNFTTKRIGTLGRVQYNFDSKYILSAAVRYDGSSRFGEKFRWGTFPSVAVAWNASSEPFWEPLENVINRFKIRFSHGQVGNDSFNDYEFESIVEPFADYIFSDDDSSVDFGSAIRSFNNRDVKWETSIQNNIGVDLSFFKNKISLTVDYYNTKKEDMLFPVTLPGSSGAFDEPELVLNIGNMTNEGLEIAANYKMSVGKSNFRFGGVFTKNKNKITKVAGESIIFNQQSNIEGEPLTTIAEGFEAGAFFLFETNGTIKTEEQLEAYRQFPSRMNAELGDLIYVDTNDDGFINNEDRVYKGSGLPDFEYGFNLNWELKGFDLSMNWFGTVGSEIYNANRQQSYIFQRHQDLVNQWTVDNPTSEIPSFRGREDENYDPRTDYWLENGDYLRLKQVTFGFSLPEDLTERIGITRFRLYLTAQNPLTITNYEGYDPEIGGNNVARRGIDSSRYPLASIYSLGFNLSF